MDGIKKASIEFTVLKNVTTSVRDLPENKKIGLELYPNPASSVVKFSYHLVNTSDVNIDLFDIRGIHLKSIRASSRPGTQKGEFDVKNLKPGCYIVRLSTPEFSVAKQIIVK